MGRRWVRLAAPAVAGAAIATMFFSALRLTGRSVPLPVQALAAGMSAVAVVAAWITVRRWLRCSKLEARLHAAQAERARLAREMHDSLSKTLDALALGAAALPSALDEPDHAARLAQTLRDGSLTAARDARALIDGLRARQADAPLHELLSAACQEWSAGTGVPVRLRVSPVAVHPELIVDIVEIAREALRNVAVHAGARLVEVTLDQDRDIVLTITDDGRGAHWASGVPSGRYGLLGMAERARLAGGKLLIAPGRSGGTTIIVSFPSWSRRQAAPAAAGHPGRVLMACAATLALAVTGLVLTAAPARQFSSRTFEPPIVQSGQPISPTPAASPSPSPSPSRSPAASPSPAVSPKRTTTPPQQPSTGKTGLCRVRYTIREQWNTGFTADIIITNLASTPIDGWSLVFSFTPNQKLLAAWDATAAQNGRVVTVSDGGRKTLIAAGQSISFGLQGNWTGANPVPSAFTLNDASCATEPVSGG
ncbi:hypothetical protein Rhe02_45260 [Rhizocola hellebori]|uniref:histidine kinase n=1 Tax=Rhizocola hellebori TaxID=1392758 RepID=A0A8J3VGK4_9ACTN|nr:cellulose binding domain-containing protein [Rhizocola hellebori]GIH06459.1 hypothetical protein Rhe02_45260 [Rhizocola hellebori]